MSPDDNPDLFLLRNAAKCRVCEDEIESFHVHDFKFCTCGSISVDGGHYYRHWSWDPQYATFEEVGEDKSEWTDDHSEWKAATLRYLSDRVEPGAEPLDRPGRDDTPWVDRFGNIALPDWK